MMWDYLLVQFGLDPNQFFVTAAVENHCSRGPSDALWGSGALDRSPALWGK